MAYPPSFCRRLQPIVFLDMGRPQRGVNADNDDSYTGSAANVGRLARAGGRAVWHPCQGAEVWRLRKGGRVAVCDMGSNTLGGEVRLEVDGEWNRGEAGREGLALVELALEWKAQFAEKGWA